MNALIFPYQPEIAEPMARYMKDLFPFCGVKKPQRALLERPFFKRKHHVINRRTDTRDFSQLSNE